MSRSNCTLLGYYGESSGNFVPTFREKLPATSLRSAILVENHALLGYYAAKSGNIVPTFRDKLPAPS